MHNTVKTHRCSSSFDCGRAPSLCNNRCRGWSRQCRSLFGGAAVAVFDQLVNFLVVAQRQILWVQFSEDYRDLHQLQFIDTVVDAPVLTLRRPGSNCLLRRLRFLRFFHRLNLRYVWRTQSTRSSSGKFLGALDVQQLLVVEGPGWRGRWESNFQVFCYPN